jgi:hypothetical protein
MSTPLLVVSRQAAFAFGGFYAVSRMSYLEDFVAEREQVEGTIKAYQAIRKETFIKKGGHLHKYYAVINVTSGQEALKGQLRGRDGKLLHPGVKNLY